MTISPINLGSFYSNSGGSSVSSGLSSGLNTDSIITALTSAQNTAITKLQDQVKTNTSQTSSLTGLSQILSSLQSALSPLSNPSSVDTSNNLFAVTSTDITSNTTQAASNFVTASVASGTASGVYTISDITSLATVTTQETNAFILPSASTSVVKDTPTAGFFSPGTITIAGQNITINSGDTLADIAQSFNDASTTTGISASVLQTSSGVYKLIFTSTKTGVDARFDLRSGGGTITSDTSGVFTNLTITPDQNGSNASFKLNNVTITRSTNAIDDLISGVTFNLQQDTTDIPNAAITIKVSPDVDSIVQGIDNFATAYNNFLKFYATQTELDSNGLPKDTAVLNSDSTLQTIYNAITNTAASLVKGLGSTAPNTLAAIGITFTDFAGDSTTPATSNILSVDNSTLKSLLQTNFSGVGKVLGDGFSSSSSTMLLYKNAYDLQGVTSFTMNIHQSTSPATYVATYTDSSGATHTSDFTATTLSTGGVTLTGDPDSIFSGMKIIYGSTGDESNISINVTQGILSRLKSTVDSAVKSSSGWIANDKTSITDKNTALQKQITTLTDQMNAQRTALQQKFSTLESAITKANSVLSYLNAQQLAGKS